ncbi:ADP-ribose pyrophosphatase YjhB, NUDIX family [Cnuella takakiae]|uniref:ADP-ribose pyrophosphatase YjhB, NUDIX family n=1 Tax=Cnuella takakiae TaxID=1302690 RepID=A0A1M5AYK0_9BACT|nr:NUDIX domain-containing protein [Cnuella takakiae]OLY93270.1 DNA mismatch repair protein MutT [Cnuella takakiae]SHF35305.1 ADP-ribose pyrophosphatase YjhB, NUDIX family [Cnuella takakiae]
MIAEYKPYEPLLLAIDCIIFGFDGTQLKALLIKRGFEPQKGKWSLMGGFVQKDESVDDAAKRILDQLTGLHDIYMEQLHVFGEVDRDPGGRVVSIAYYALIKIDDYSKELMESHQAEWFAMDEIPPLIFDHKKMISMARERLRQKVANYPIGFALLPNKFTLPQLQALYEAIYETELDKRNFTRKILSFEILQKLEEKEKESSRKGAYLYVFDDKKYRKLEKDGFKMM